MNTARIVVLTIAVGAGGIAACPARGADSRGARLAEPAVRNRVRANGGPMSLALNRITDLNIIQSSARDDQAYRRGDNINATARK